MVLPIFILVVLAGLQFGWAQHASGSVNFALEQSSRTLLLNPSLDESAVRALVLGKLDAGTAANVTVTLARFSTDGTPTARVTGVYRQTIGLPGLATIPFNYTRMVVTPLPWSP